MSGTKILLDSNAIIYASKGLINAEKLLAAADQFFVSIITYIEVYAFDFSGSGEKEIIDEIMRSLEVVEITAPIADQAIIYRKSSVKKIKLPDAVILATAKLVEADLVTDNYRDFLHIDDSINIVGLDIFRE